MNLKKLQSVVSNRTFFLFIFLLLLVVGWFYWFQYRPSQLRQECTKNVYSNFDISPSNLSEQEVKLAEKIYANLKRKKEYQVNELLSLIKNVRIKTRIVDLLNRDSASSLLNNLYMQCLHSKGL